MKCSRFASRFRPRRCRRFVLRAASLAVSMFAGGVFPAAADDAAPAPVRIAFFSDTHIPEASGDRYKGFDMAGNLRKAVGQMVEYAPAAAVLCGDAARLQGKIGDYEALRKLLAPLMAKCPVAIAMGNHDNRANFRSVFDAKPPGAVNPAAVGGHHVMVLEWPVVRLIVLDSLEVTNRTPGLLGKEQLGWLKKFLGEHDARATVLVLHHPPYSVNKALKDTHALLELLKPFPQVKALVFGHTHHWSHRILLGLQWINLPAMGYSFDKRQPVGWVAAEFHPGGVDLTLHTIAGDPSRNATSTSLKWQR